jgi:hypothetical protein
MPNPILEQDRVAFLKARDSSGMIVVPAWPRQKKELPLIEVEVSWVRFSTLNHRTRAEQMREVHRAGKPDLFTADPLGGEAQDAQYRILKNQDGFNALKADLMDRGQQEPAIITADGVLINGNRRSAAMRSLCQDDKHLKARYINCLMLPEDATLAELVDLEAELQVARDFKEEYSWINEALLIEELYDRENKDFERVAKRMHRPASEVRSLHEKLQQVHQLVGLSNGARLHIDFKDNESAFDELAKHIRNKPTAEADGVRATYLLGTLADVNYRKLRHLRRPDAAVLVRREIENDPTLKPLLDTISEDAPSMIPNDPLDDILGTPAKDPGLNDILSFLATKRPEETVAFAGGGGVAAKDILETIQSAINAAADEAEEEERDQTAVTAPLVRSDKAIAELERATSSLPKARSFDEWNESELEAKIKKLETLVSKLGSSS